MMKFLLLASLLLAVVKMTLAGEQGGGQFDLSPDQLAEAKVAIEAADWDRVRSLLGLRSKREEAIIAAVRSESVEDLLSLLEIPTYRDLFREVRSGGDADRVRKMLSRGYDANARNEEGYTVLMVAARHSHAAVIRVLVKVGGAELDARHPVTLGTALMSAVAFKNDAAVRELVHLGADIDAVSVGGATALGLAHGMRTEAASILRAAGARLWWEQ